jgi:hypothetical protein
MNEVKNKHKIVRMYIASQGNLWDDKEKTHL